MRFYRKESSSPHPAIVPIEGAVLFELQTFPKLLLLLVPKVTTRSLYPKCIANLKLPIDAFYRESRSDWIIRVTSDVDFDDYGEFGYQLEPEYTE
jgi:hypothetical protein